MTFDNPIAKNPVGGGDLGAGEGLDFLGAGVGVGLRGGKIDRVGKGDSENQKWRQPKNDYPYCRVYGVVRQSLLGGKGPTERNCPVKSVFLAAYGPVPFNGTRRPAKKTPGNKAWDAIESRFCSRHSLEGTSKIFAS